MVWETILIFIWDLLKQWLFTIFVAPAKNFNMLWILVPVYLTWFFAEFFQEKQGTSMGNAITNAVVVFWGGFDWIRGTVTKLSDGRLLFGWQATGRIILCSFLIAYGIAIVTLGIKGNKLVKYIGRIRQVTYIVVMFTPVFYEVITLTWYHVLAVVVFSPVFYFTIELIDRVTPNPKAVQEDIEDASKGGSDSGLGGGTDFGSGSGDASGGLDDFGKGGGLDDFKL
ncbi:hypothetical protein ACFL96_11020 [Thermoproteota archaeon]